MSRRFKMSLYLGSFFPLVSIFFPLAFLFLKSSLFTLSKSNFFVWFAVLALLINVIVLIALTLHVFRNPRFNGGQKFVGLVLLWFGGLVSFPVYGYSQVWAEKGFTHLLKIFVVVFLLVVLVTLGFVASINRTSSKIEKIKSGNDVQGMIDLLQAPSSMTRWQAAEALAKMQPLPESSFPILIARLNDEDDSVRMHVEDALLASGSLAVPYLQKALLDPEFRIRNTAKSLLSQMHVDSQKTVEESEKQFVGEPLEVTIYTVEGFKPVWSENEGSRDNVWHFSLEGKGYATTTNGRNLFSPENPGQVKIIAQTRVNNGLGGWDLMAKAAQSRTGIKTYFKGRGFLVEPDEVRIMEPGGAGSTPVNSTHQ